MNEQRRTVAAAAVLVLLAAAAASLRLALPAPPGPSPAAVLDLTRLAPDERSAAAVLLVLPLGVLLTALCRNLVGLPTFGAFLPTLLALGFLYADVRTGATVFVLVMGLVLLGRAILDGLKLHTVPRMGVILSATVLALATAVSILDYLGAPAGPQAVILPTIILVLLAERFYVCSEDEGLAYAFALLAGTLAVAAGCLALLRWEALGRIAVRFPEAQLAVAAVLLCLGRYSGYRLTEWVRFRALARGNRAGDDDGR